MEDKKEKKIIYIFLYTICIPYAVRVWIFMISPLESLLGIYLYKEVCLEIFKCMSY